MSNDTHERLKIKSQPVAKQDPRVRISNWQETFLGFSPENAKLEAMRCIQCPDAPCQAARAAATSARLPVNRYMLELPALLFRWLTATAATLYLAAKLARGAKRLRISAFL
ncbi:MAG: hypothetical protein IIB27_02250 [Chloroflexi bacterium]|nr:hypothetical protein [Chloroflexota bacterium]